MKLNIIDFRENYPQIFDLVQYTFKPYMRELGQ